MTDLACLTCAGLPNNRTAEFHVAPAGSETDGGMAQTLTGLTAASGQALPFILCNIGCFALFVGRGLASRQAPQISDRPNHT